MPRSVQLFSPSTAGIPNNPLVKLGFDPTKIITDGPFDIGANLENLIDEFITAFLTYLDQVTGLDLIVFWDTIEQLLTNLQTIFGELNPQSPTFDPLLAVQTLLQLIVTEFADLPSVLIADVITAFTGGSGGALGILQQLIDGLTNFLGVGGTGNTLSTLLGLLDNIPLIGQLVTAITGSTGTLSDLTTFIQDLLGAFGSSTTIVEVESFISGLSSDASTAIGDLATFLSGTGFTGDPAGLATLINTLTTNVSSAVSNFTTLFSLTSTDATSLAGIINALTPDIAASLSALLADLGLADVPSFASFLTSIFPGFLPLIPASHIRNINPELLLNPGFDTSTSVTGGVGFTWDGSVGHTAVGSAKAACDGATRFWLLSNPIAVATGDQLAMSIWVEWASLTTSGPSPAPIRLEAQPYGPTAFPVTSYLSSHGALTATANAKKFVLTAALPGHGALKALAEAQNPTTHVYNRFASLHGKGSLTATAHSTKFAFTGNVAGHGSLSATAKAIIAVGDFARTPVVLQAETSPATNSGWTQLSGTYTVPVGGVDTVYLQPVVDVTATGGTVWFDDASVTKAGALTGATGLVDFAENLLTNLFGSNTILGQLLDDLLPSVLGGANLGADVQAIVDKILNALGVGGTGHTLATLLSNLETIPFGNITSIFGLGSLGADLQAVVDNLANGLGFVGTGHTLANLLAYIAEIPNVNITSIFGLSNLGADVQAVVDKISNAFGQGGTGHTLANLLAYAEAIPYANLTAVLGTTNIGTDVQAIVDKISNALGQAGTGHTLANLLSYMGAIPATVVTNVLGGANLGADVQAIVDKISNALGVVGTGHTLTNLVSYLEAIPGGNVSGITVAGQGIVDAIYQAINGGASTGNLISTIKTGLEGIPQANVSGLAATISGLLTSTTFQSLLDNISNALGHAGTGHTLANILTYLQAIPYTVLTSALGQASLGADVQAIVDQLSNAFGHTGTGHTLANLLTYAEAIPNTVITNILGGASLGADVGAIATTLFGGNTTASHILSTAVTNVLGGANLGADVQAIVDKLANAFGQAGTGHTLANLLAYAEAIPFGNVTAVLGTTNLGTDLQGVVDKISNALGQAGTGHSLANLLAYMEAIPSTVVTNVLGGANLGADVQAIVDKLSNALGQAGTGHTLANLLAYAQAIPSANLTAVLGTTNLGTDLQAVVDKISNALGVGGTGHTLANLLSYLGAIPSGNLTAVLGTANLGSDVQALVEAIFGAMSAFPGVGVNPTLPAQGVLSAKTKQIAKSAAALPGHGVLSALAEGQFPATHVYDRRPHLSGHGVLSAAVHSHKFTEHPALSGTGTLTATVQADFNGTVTSTVQGALGSIPYANITAILGETNLGTDLQAVVTQATTALGGATSTLEGLVAQLGSIPFGNVTTALGNDNLGADVQALLAGAASGATATGAPSVASLQQAINGIASLLGFNTASPPPATSTSGITQTNNQFIAQQAVSRASYIAVDPTGDPTFNFDRLSGGSLPTISITQTATIIGMIGTPLGGVKESVAWLGCGYTGAITNFYVTLYSVNTSTGALTWVSTSSDLMAGGTPPPSSSTPAWYYYDLPTPDFLTVAQGNWYAVELQVIGSGTYTLAGITHQAPANGNVFPSQIGATRNPIATAAYGTTGTGNSSGSGSVASLTTTHTPGATDNGVVCYVAISAFSGTASAPASVTYAGNVMTLTTSEVAQLASVGTIYAYTYSVPVGTVLPQSANSVVATFGGGTNPKVAIINCDSFSGVGSFAALAVADGQTTSFTQTVASATGDVVSQAFIGVVGAAHTTISAYNKTQTYNAGVSDSTVVGNTLTMGYTAGAASLTFTATANSSTNYGGVAVNIIPGYSPTAPGTVSSPTGSTNYPFLELCGSAGTTMYPPTLTTFNTSGTYTIPVWATAVDIVSFGGGGGGAVFGGYGGAAGSWASYTLTGAPLVAAGSTIAVTVGGGGAGGTSPGGGGTSEVNITGLGNEAIAAGGGGAANTGSSNGGGAGTQTFNGEPYYGGAATASYASAPGGGGAMGPFYPPTNYPGAAGAVFVLAYQV